MDERETVAAFIERIVAGAHIPSRVEREDLRRELWTHFDETGTSPDATHTALRRFGAEAMVTESLRRVYRIDYVLLYFVKIAASIIASIAAALLIQVVVNLRVEMEAEVWRLAPGFLHAAGLSVGVVLALVTVWEVGRRPFNRSRAVAAIGAYAAVCLLVQLAFVHNAGAFVTATLLAVLGYFCSKFGSRPAKILLTFGAFAVTQYSTHLVLRVAFGPSRAVLAAAVLVAVWSSTVVILTRFDHAFVNVFETANGG
ncbi:MAG: hypothetical protein DMF91_14685 [Acidobacteria bacterium]|nr:MAG: hypothetical protein DMF91_14685 [Acidobacteriota bacterium]